VRAVVVGAGAVGRRVAISLTQIPGTEVVLVVARQPARVEELLGEQAGRVKIECAPSRLPPAEVVVVAAPGCSKRTAEAALAFEAHTISVSDDPSEVKDLLALDGAAASAGRAIVAGAAMSPGLSCVLAAHLARGFERVEEVHVASVGTGGPACARRRHAALTALAHDWEDGQWRRRPGGSGRELVWFPHPVGGADCYRAGLATPWLLAPAFPGCRRLTARLEATRRDRLTSWMPMLRPPHPEGLIGAVRVEVRGWRDGRAETSILGVAVRPALGAAAVATQAARWAVEGRLARPGAGGMAVMVPQPGTFLRELAATGITVSVFEGAPSR
jgi:saccharopine dehydrogenase-like NADP-dependent oxidoreductase